MTTFTAMPKYEAYKDSGVDWIGFVPDSWEISRLGAVFEERRVKVSDMDYPPLSVTKSGILPQLDSAAKTKDGDNRKQVLTGDFVINSRSDRKGSSGVSSLDGSVSLINIVLKPKRINPSFCNHLLKCNAFIEEYYRVGRGIVADLWTTRYDEMRTMMLALPSSEEQTAIATFLDEKTAKIDEAIAIKEKQIELLKERKQIIIQQAVTQGLDPTVPMKDSGVEWIGKIPAHWEVKKLKYLGKSIIGLTYSPSDLYGENGGTLVARSSNLFEGKFKYGEKENVYVRCRIPSHLLLRKGDILICSRNGSRDLIGKCAYVSCVDEGNSFGAFTTVFRSNMNEYLFHILNSDIFKMLSGSFLTSTINQLTINNLNSIAVPLPPIPERLVIINYLSEISERFDKSMELLFKQIEKLKEYKTTLINSAVTGKIKVV